MATADPEKILNKLKSFNSDNASDETKVNENVLSDAIALTRCEGGAPDGQIESLRCLLKWPRGILFPVLDIARLAVRSEPICKSLIDAEIFRTIVDCISDSAANQLMALRCLANMLIHQVGRDVVRKRLGEVLGRVSEIRKGSVNAQVAVATFLLNATVTQMTLADADECKILGECILETLQWLDDPESAYRCFQALGNLTCTPIGQEIVALIISSDAVIDKLKLSSGGNIPIGFEKLSQCSKDLCASLGV